MSHDDAVSPRQRRRSWRESEVRAMPVAALLVVLALLYGPIAVATPGVELARPQLRSAPGDSRTEPVPVGTELTAGPWKLTVTDVVSGDAANQQVLAASGANEPTIDGLSYVLADVRAVNAGTESESISSEDFGFTGGSGVVIRSVDATPPEPGFGGTVDPGGSVEGWIVGAGELSDAQQLLFFDSLELSGDWADRYFALSPGATVAATTAPAAQVNAAGANPAEPAGINVQVVTADWVVEIIDVATGQDVYDLFPASDYRTTALGDAAPGLIPYWVAILVRVTNNQVGDVRTHFPSTAFQLAYADGGPVPDVRILSAPAPDASGDYYPAGSREGWVAFELPADYDGSLLRFGPYRSSEDARYLTWGDGSAPATDPTTASTPGPPTATFASGEAAIVTDDDVNLRAEPSLDADVVEILTSGTEVAVTGAAVSADGFDWYPVTTADTGKSGFVAANFLRPPE